MEPVISNTDIVIVKNHPLWDDVRNKVCAVRTPDGITLKKVQIDYQRGQILLLSISIQNFSVLIIDSDQTDTVGLIGPVMLQLRVFWFALNSLITAISKTSPEQFQICSFRVLNDAKTVQIGLWHSLNIVRYKSAPHKALSPLGTVPLHLQFTVSVYTQGGADEVNKKPFSDGGTNYFQRRRTFGSWGLRGCFWKYSGKAWKIKKKIKKNFWGGPPFKGFPGEKAPGL